MTAPQAGVLGVSDVDQGVPWAGEVCVGVEDGPSGVEGIKHGLSAGEVISVSLCCAVGIRTERDMTVSQERRCRNALRFEHDLIPSPQADSSCDKRWVDGLRDGLHGSD